MRVNTVLPQACVHWLFGQVSPAPFERMRRVWAAVALWTWSVQWQDIVLLYGEEMWPLYALLLVALCIVLLGMIPRGGTACAVLLLYVVLALYPLAWGGGEVLLYILGVILLLPPTVIWPRRLLLWQLVVMYLASAWHKLLGTMWIDGQAVGILLQHPDFARFDLPMSVIDVLSPWIGWGVIGWELMWAFVLIPGSRLQPLLIKTGIIFHVLIFLFLDVGAFSPAVLTAYLGLSATKKVST